MVKIIGKMILPKEEKKAEVRKEIIHFFADRKGKVIGRLESGKIAVIDFNYKGDWVKADSDWEVEVIREEEKKAVIKPLTCFITPEENEKMMLSSIEELKNKFNKTTF